MALSVGYLIERPNFRPELSADLIEQIDYIVATQFNEMNIFHNQDIKRLECHIREMVSNSFSCHLIPYERYRNFQFFIRMLGYGRSFNCVVIVRDYNYDYKIYYKKPNTLEQ